MPSKSILLIHPPVSKPCEPPAGLAKLARSLHDQGIDGRVYDANIDCLLGVLGQPSTANDTWTRRAQRHRQANLDALRSPDLYANRDRYKRAVMDTNRALSMVGKPYGVHLTLGNYASTRLSPVRSADLLKEAERFCDNPFTPIFSHTLMNLFDSWEPDLIGISINFMSQALCAFSIIGFIKKQFPGKTIVCGGGLVTSWVATPALGNPFSELVDELVGGPGEARLISLCKENVTEKTDVRHPVTGYDFSGFAIDRYLSPHPVLPYSTSRGCYWKKCAFCPEKTENQPYQTATPSDLLDDLTQNIHRTSAGLVHFLDNALSPRFMHHLIDHPPGVHWYGFARFTHHLADPHFVYGLKHSGCVMLKLGVESGDQRVLDRLSKGIELHLVSKALATLHRAGIATYVYLLFGTPAENENSAVKTLDFTVANAANIDFLNLAIFNLPASSEDARALDTGDFYAGDLSLYRDFVHPLGWHRDRVRRFLTKKFRKPPAIRTIIASDPPFFTSNHAPFFNLPQPFHQLM